MINDVVEKKLCTQCGFCAAVCPENAIVMKRDQWLNNYPQVIEDKCTLCGECIRICSGRQFSYAAQSIEERDKTTSPCRSLLGPYLAVRSGYSLDGALRHRASSGGVVSAILTGLLEKKLVDKVLIVRGSQNNCFEAEAGFVSRIEDIEKSSRSWYLPVSMDQAAKEMLDNDGSYAVAGLPCHIHAWRKASAMQPRVAGRLKFCVGLFCDHVFDVRWPYLLLRAFGAPPERVRSIAFRGDGWPGRIRAVMDDGKQVSIPYKHPLRKLLSKMYLFTARRCLLCYDALAEFADISAGDAWLPEYEDEGEGRNAVIIRSRRGNDLLSSMEREGRIHLEPMGIDRLIRSQRMQLTMKKKEIGARFRIIGALGGHVPRMDINLPRPTAFGYLLGAGSLLTSSVSSRRWFYRLAGSIAMRAPASFCRGKEGPG